MSDQMKNRVVGAIVLFSLAIIFLPKIFDGEKESQRREFVAIPKKPIHQVPDISKVLTSNNKKSQLKDNTNSQSRPTTNASNAVIKQSTAVKVVEVVSKNTSITLPKESIKAQAWVIRMGSFGNPDNVKALVAKLRKKGFTAFSIPSAPKVGSVNKVYVGPELNKKMLIKLQPKLKRLFKEGGVIEKYEPLQ